MKRLRRAWRWFRLSRGYCEFCENHRNQHPTLCDVHCRLWEEGLSSDEVTP